MNTEFQDDNLNDNQVPYVSALLNIAVEDFDDPDLIFNATSNGSGANSSYQLVGIDVSPNRSSKKLFGFNYFRISEEITTTIPGDRRRVVVLNGSTGEVLLNESAESSGTAQAARVITAINSVAMAPEESFALWISETAILAGEQGENDDPDGDGLTNLLEYALGTHPAVADAEKGPQIENGPQGLQLVFQRSKTAAVDPIVIETGGSLDDFTSFSPASEDVEVTDQGETERVSVHLTGMSGKFFARLRTSAQ